MHESPELLAMARRAFVATFVDHDPVAAQNLFGMSKSPNNRMIFAGDAEVFQGFGTDRDGELIVRRAIERGTTEIDFELIEAYEHGDVGWLAAVLIVHRSIGEPVKARFTGTFVLEEGVWRLAQWHSSSAVDPVESWGIELSEDLNNLLRSLGADAQTAIVESSDSGTVTLLFSDVEGSTALSESVGDRAWASMISSHLAALQATVEECHGTVVKTLGDGAMAAFGSVTDALRCALELQEAAESSTLRIRIGIHTGDAVLSDGDYLGITVNKAARIASAAEPDEILLSSATAEMAAGRHFVLGSERTAELKGITGTHRLVQLTAAPPT